MDIKRIVLKQGDKLPESCAGSCDHKTITGAGVHPNPCHFFMVDEGLWCFVTGKSIEKNNNPYETRPDFCPLVIEETCLWVLRDFDGRKMYNSPESCGYHATQPEFIFCPVCGRRIVYESEM